MATKNELSVGMVVWFGRTHGEKTKGEIVKVNPTACKVRQLESRGMYRDHPVDSVWRVPFSLIFLTDTDVVQAEETPVHRRAPRRRRHYHYDYD